MMITPSVKPAMISCSCVRLTLLSTVLSEPIVARSDPTFFFARNDASFDVAATDLCSPCANSRLTSLFLEVLVG